MRLIEGKKLDIIKKTIENYGGTFELPENNLLLIVGDEVFFVNKLIYEKVLDEKINENLISVGTQIGNFKRVISY